MVRRCTLGETKKFRPLYWILVAAVVALWIWGFKLYFRRYEYLHPEVTWAVPGISEELVEVDGALLWKEVTLSAPFEGVVRYPQGTGPVRVGRGSVVAVIESGSRRAEIKAGQQGYFVGGVDGSEPSWKYAELWPGTDIIPRAAELSLLRDGAAASQGGAVGKLIEQPQELRFIGYADVRGDMARQLKNKRLRVKMDKEDTVSTAGIRVYNEMAGGKVKLYLTLPWFQPSLLSSRNYRLFIDAGSTDGAVIPESALLRKEGGLGVYKIRGARVVFSPVAGKYLGGGKFLVTDGLSVGDAVVAEASSAREGRIQLW